MLTLEVLITSDYGPKLQVSKGQAAALPSLSSSNKLVSSEWHNIPEPHSQPSVASRNPIERSGEETLEEASALEDECNFYIAFVMLQFVDVLNLQLRHPEVLLICIP